MENLKEYLVIVDLIVVDGEEMPVVETQFLDDLDVQQDYVWADEEQTILKPKGLEL